jgi:hypothetical protein
MRVTLGHPRNTVASLRRFLNCLAQTRTACGGELHVGTADSTQRVVSCGLGLYLGWDIDHNVGRLSAYAFTYGLSPT